MTQDKAHLEAAEHLDELLPVESAHLHIRQIIERREESARIVGHLHKVSEIDDMLLAYTDKRRTSATIMSLVTFRFSRMGLSSPETYISHTLESC